MKRVVWFCYGIGLFFSVPLAQGQGGVDSPVYQSAMRIEAGMRMTTNILFHYKIRQVDRGSGDLMAKICNDTVLLVKAGQPSFSLTNLSVYTADGKLHAFIVKYAAEPEHLWVSMGETGRPGAIMTEDSLEYYCGAAAAATPGRRGLRDRRYGLCWELRGLYARSNLLFFALQLSNHSPIDYVPGTIGFVIRDKHRVKRSASQERDITPVYLQGSMERIGANSQRILVFALPVFTVAAKQRLHIVIAEKDGGGRDLSITVEARILSNAKRMVPPLN